MILIQLTQEQLNKNKDSIHFMTKEEIIACTEVPKLRRRHSILFHKMISGAGDRYDLIELMRIVQRMSDLGEPFYY